MTEPFCAALTILAARLLWHAPRCTGPTPADRCPMAGGLNTLDAERFMTRTKEEREDAAWANGVQACLQRLYAAGARRDEHHRAWEDCERMWRTRYEQVLDSVKARTDGETPEGK